MKHLFFLLILLIPGFVHAQIDPRYMPGTVPVVDGQVTFTRNISLPGQSQDMIYSKAVRWAGNRFKPCPPFQSRILFSDPKTGQVVCLGQEYLVFADKALSLDRAVINYQMYLECQDSRISLKINTIRYRYNVADRQELIPAEEQITDEFSFNRKKDRLIKATGKFRIHTIDLVERIFHEVEKECGAARQTAVQPQAPSAPVQTPQAAVASIPAAVGTAGLAGYKRISPDKIPGNIYKMLDEDWMLITAGKDSGFNMMTAAWGGLGHLFNRPVFYCFIRPATYTYKFMEDNDTYTVSFYTEAHRDALKYCGSHSGREEDKVKGSGLTPITTPSGSKAFSEAWMVIECRKIVSQPFALGAVLDAEIQKRWGEKHHRMYIGEILNVWVK